MSKTPLLPPSRRRRLRMIRAIVLAGLATSLPHFAEERETAETKDQIFFLGLDVFLDEPEGLLPVRGFSRGSVNVVTDGVPNPVTLRTLKNLRTKIEPKISATSLTLAEVGGRRSYTSANDPMMQAIRMESQMIAEQMHLGMLEARAQNELAAAQAAMGAPIPAYSDPAEISAQRTSELIRTQSSLGNIRGAQGTGEYDPIWRVQRAGEEEYLANADAYTVSFTVSSPRTIEHGYAILVTRVQYPGTTQPVNALEFQALPVLDASPRKIEIMQGGLPLGYTVDGYDIHIFEADGTELATNHSGKRVALTTAEAFEFLLFQHVNNNKLANLPAQVVTALLPEDIHLRIPQGQGDRRVQVELDEKGNVLRVDLLDSGPSELDALLEEDISTVYFFPALAFGQPIETVTTFPLSDFTR